MHEWKLLLDSKKVVVFFESAKANLWITYTNFEISKITLFFYVDNE